MEFGQFFQGILEHWASELLLALGTIAFAFLRKKTNWAPVALYAFAGCVGVSILIFTFTGRPIFSPIPTNESNIEPRIKEWVSHYGYGIQAAQTNLPNTDFAYGVAAPNGMSVILYRETKNRPTYLQLAETIIISPEHVQILQKLTPTEAQGVLGAAEAEIFRRDLAFALDNSDANQVKEITITKSVPISTLTEASFGGAIDDLSSTVALTRYQFVLEIGRYAERGQSRVQ